MEKLDKSGSQEHRTAFVAAQASRTTSVVCARPSFAGIATDGGRRNKAMMKTIRRAPDEAGPSGF
jgi:hypothetical protein